MDRKHTRRAVQHMLAVAALALGISGLGLGCSGSGGKSNSLTTGSGTQASSGAGTATTTIAAGSPGGATTAPGGSPTTGSTGTPTTRATSSTTKTTTPAGHGTGTTQPTTATTQPVATGPQPTTPGVYTFTGSGTSTFTTNGTTSRYPAATEVNLTIMGSGSTEQWSNTVTTDNLTFNSSGVFITSELLSSGTGTPGTSCTFANPVAYPPWPLAVGGKPSSGTANCGSGTLNLIVRVASQSGSNFVVTITQTSGPLTVVETDTYSPSRRMPIATAFAIAGSYGGTSFSTQSSYTLS